MISSDSKYAKMAKIYILYKGVKNYGYLRTEETLPIKQGEMVQG